MQEESISRIKLLISKGKTKEAIELLLKETTLNEEVLLISSRFEDLERKYNSNFINNEDKNVQKSRIEASILKFLQSQKSSSFKNHENKQKLHQYKKVSFGKTIITTFILVGVGYTIISILLSLTTLNSTKPAEEMIPSKEKYAETGFIDSSGLDLEVSSTIDNFDSTAIFNTETEIVEAAARDFLSIEYTPNDYFEKLIVNKEFDLALKALDVAQQKNPGKNDKIIARRKSIILMRKASFDNVWFSFPGELILTIRNEKEGLYDRNGKELFKPQFDEIDPLKFEYLYCTKLEEQYGLIDYYGKEIFEPYFDEIFMINPDGLIGTLKNGSYGVLSKEGDELYPPVFEELELEESAMSIIRVKENGKYGYLNSKGEMIVKTNLDYVEQEWEETFFIRIGKKWGVIDTEGQFKLKVEYDKLKYNVDSNIIIAEKDGEKYYFTDDGQPTKDPQKR